MEGRSIEIVYGETSRGQSVTGFQVHRTPINNGGE